MASLWESPRSKYWQGAFRDATGRRRNRSTKVLVHGRNPTEAMKLRRRAQRIADDFEEASRNRKTVEQLRRTVAALQAELGVDLPATPVLREFIEGWVERRKPAVKPATHAFHRGVARKLLAFLEAEGLADRPIDALTRDHGTRWRNSMAEGGRSATTVNHLVKGARGMFEDARRDGHLDRNPLEFVEGVKGRGGVKRRPFTPDEIEAVLGVATGEWRSLFLLGLGTGQRLGDLAALRWSQVDLERRELRVVTRKTGRSLRIPLAEGLVDHFASMDAGDDPEAAVHPEAAATLEARGGTAKLSRQFARVLEAAGLRGKGEAGNGLTFHSTRHTAVSRLHEAGIAPAVIRSLVGHEDGAAHDGYITVGREALQAAAEKLGEAGGL